MLAVHVDIFVHGRDAPGLEIVNRHDRAARGIPRGHHPVHQMIGEVGQRIAQRAEFPVQHRDHFRLGRMQHHIVEAIVAMHDRGLVARRDVLRQPFDQLFHLRNVLGLGRLVLFRPAMDLAGHVVAFLAKAFEPGGAPIDIVEIGKGLHLRLIDRAALGRLIIGQCAIPQDAAFHHVHDIKHRADDTFIGAQAIWPRNGVSQRIERGNHAIFAVHGMRARQQLARWLAAHDIFLVRRDQLIGRVGLAALELAHFQRAFIALDIGVHPGGELRLIEFVRLDHRLGACEQFCSGFSLGHFLPSFVQLFLSYHTHGLRDAKAFRDVRTGQFT